MKSVTNSFDGYNTDEIAQRFYTWIVDGGHMDAISEEMSDDKTNVDGLSDFDNEALTMVFDCRKP